MTEMMGYEPPEGELTAGEPYEYEGETYAKLFGRPTRRFFHLCT